MCTRALVLLAILAVGISPTFATQTLYQIKDFGKVKTRVFFDNPNRRVFTFAYEVDL